MGVRKYTMLEREVHQQFISHIYTSPRENGPCRAIWELYVGKVNNQWLWEADFVV
jgi:hypothetical protein